LLLLLPRLLLTLAIYLLLLLATCIVRGLTLLFAGLPLLYHAGCILTLPPLVLLANLVRTHLAPIIRALPLLSLDLSLLLPLLFCGCALLLPLLFRGRTLLLPLLLGRLLLSRSICSILVLLGPAISLLFDLLLLLVLVIFISAASPSLSHRSGNH